MNDQLPGYIRTYIPIVSVLLGRELAKRGLDVDSELLAVVVGIIFAAVYYAVVRFLEKRKSVFGWLLGVAKQPAYSTEPAPSPGPGEDVEAIVVPGDVTAER